MKRVIFIVIYSWTLFTSAQETLLVVDNLRVETQVDVYGIEQQVLLGDVTNNDTVAYSDVTLTGDVLNAEEEIIGEAFGYIVNACGVALLDDPLQPNETAVFALPLDLYSEFEGDAAIPETFEVQASGIETTVEGNATNEAIEGVNQISASEVVAVEWVASDVLLYGVGCDERIFTSYQWSRYDLTTERSTRLAANPNETFITEQTITATGVTRLTANRQLNDPTLLTRSFYSFIPNTTRIIWQNDKHDLYTAERDGSTGRREVHTFLHQYSLRGFVFSPDENFLAYYFGAYGEPVRYLTSTPNGSLQSDVITRNQMSSTVPGLQYDARRVIISGTLDGITGYYFQSAQTPQKELLFEIPEEELAGNNYPAPAYFRRDDETRFIYIIRPIEGQATLQCYHYEGKTLTTVTPLPLQLATDERAWAWLSPDGSQLAIAANGRHAGLWLVDIVGCEG